MNMSYESFSLKNLLWKLLSTVWSWKLILGHSWSMNEHHHRTVLVFRNWVLQLAQSLQRLVHHARFLQQMWSTGQKVANHNLLTWNVCFLSDFNIVRSYIDIIYVYIVRVDSAAIWRFQASAPKKCLMAVEIFQRYTAKSLPVPYLSPIIEGIL